MRSIGRQTASLTAIHQHCLLQLQDKAQKRLQVLTVIAAIFLPMMLVTGIYGMNFQSMPELSWKYCCLGVIVLMGIVADSLLRVFSCKKRFK